MCKYLSTGYGVPDTSTLQLLGPRSLSFGLPYANHGSQLCP